MEEGYRKLEIYRLARSVATLIHTVTLSSPGWQPETASGLRQSVKAIVLKIITAFSQPAQTEFVQTLGEASALCSEIVGVMASPQAFRALPKEERADLLLSTRRLLEALHGSMSFKQDDPRSLFYRPWTHKESQIPPTEASSRELEGKVILITRPLQQSQRMVEMIGELGGLPVVIPMIEIVDPDSWDPVDRSIVNLRGYDGVIFTSRNSVDRFLARMETINYAAKKVLSTRRIYAAGEKTAAALEKAELHAALIPENFSAQGLIDAMQRESLAGRHFLFPKSNRAKDDLPEALRSRNAVVDEVDVYRTVGPSEIHAEPLLEALRRNELDAITFFSPSSVENFFHLLGTTSMGKTVAACVGPSTAKEAEASGLPVVITARAATAESLTESLVEHFARFHNRSSDENSAKSE